MISNEDAKKLVENALRKFEIPFDRDTRVFANESVSFPVDFLVPNKENPKYIIEAKSNLAEIAVLGNIHPRYKGVRLQYGIRTILVSDFSTYSKENLNAILQEADFAVDFIELMRLKEIIKV